MPEGATGKDDISDYLSVRVDDPTLCPRYCAKAVKNVKIAPSPLWLVTARLRASRDETYKQHRRHHKLCHA